MSNMRKINLTLLAFFAMLSTAAQADPVVSLYGPANQGITAISFSFNSATNTITINQTVGNTGSGVLQISGLTANVNYTVINQITNNSGVAFNRLANELLDPAGNPNDNLDPQPYPSFVPPGFTTSNDFDGLNFAQGSGIPRISSVFSSVLADEASNARDFLDFFNGTAVSGSTFSVQYGLRDNVGTNQPFLLSQRANIASTQEPIPEPTTMLLLGTGLAGVGAAVRKRRQARTS